MSIPRTTPFTLKRIVSEIANIPDKGFAEETPKLTPEQKRRLQEMASMFEEYGKAIANEEAIVNSAKSLTELCELAEAYALNECGDWFQQDQVKKDMKDLKKRIMEYNKLAKESYARMQQLGCAYQDIGHVLGRYYKLEKSPGTNQHLNEPTTGKQPLQNEDLQVKCAWCGKDMGTKKADNTGISHGICPECMKDQLGDTDLKTSSQNVDKNIGAMERDPTFRPSPFNK